MVLELRHIRYFLAVARQGNFSRAAAQLGIGQPPLSLQIKDLEAEVGASLFRRSVHGAELTVAGRAFLDVVGVMPELAEQGIRAVQKASRGEVGSLRVGFTASSAFCPVVTRTVRAFCLAFPEVDVWLEESNTAPLAAGLEKGAFDAAFLRPGDALGNDLQLRTVLEEPVLVALPTGHHAAGHGEVDLFDLKEDSFMLFSREVGPNLYDLIIDACRSAAFEPHIRHYTLQFSSIINFVSAGLGVSVIPSSISRLNFPDLKLCAIKNHTATSALALACQKGNRSAVVQNFMATPIDV